MQHMRVLAGLIALGASAWGADSRLLNLVMPGAKVVSGVNVLNAKSSPFGRFAITQIESKGAGLQQLIAATGFNPLTDVTEMLAASASDPAHPGGFVAMAGTFNVTQIAAAVSADKTISIGSSDNVTTFTFPAPAGKLKPALAFIGTSIAIAGDSVTVQAALGQSNTIDPALAAQIASLSASEDAWIVSTASIASLLPGNLAGKGIPGQAAQILSSVQSFSGGVKLGDPNRVSADLIANSPQNAAALGSVMQMAVTMFSMNANADAAKNPQLAALLPLLQTAVISATGNDLHLALAVPESQLEALAGTHSGN